MKDNHDPRSAPRPPLHLDRPLRVLISGYRSHPHVGGQGVYVRELSRALRTAGCEVSVISGPPYPELDEGIELIRLPSLDLFEVDNAFKALRWHHLKNKADRGEWLAHNTGAFGELTAFGRRLNAFLKREGHRFDVLHDNQTLAPAMIAIDQRLPVITTLHHPIAIDLDFALQGQDKRIDRVLTRRWYSFIKRQAYTAQRLRYFLAVSEASKTSYGQYCGVKPDGVHIAYNGLDHHLFYPDARVQRDPNRLIAVASADAPIKGLDVIIAALAHLVPTRPDLRLMVIGALREGPTKRALEDHKLMDRVNFRSGLSGEDMAQAFREAGLFVSASRFEGFGFPPAEAMACGTPVVVSDGGALPEVAGPAGLVTPVNDSAALATAIAHMLDHPEEAQQRAQLGLDHVQRHFTWSHHADSAIHLYQRALGLTSSLQHAQAAE